MVNFCTMEPDVPVVTQKALVPISSGEEQCAPNHAWGAGVRPHYLIHYVISGKGIFYCGTKRYQVQKGQIFLIFPGTIVKYKADEKNPWHYVWVNFYGDEAKMILSEIGLSAEKPVMSVKNSSAVRELFHSMPHERGADLCNSLRFTAKLYEFMSLLSDNRREEERNEEIYLETAIRYIKAHYFEALTVDGLASQIGISRKYLFAIFKKALGVSPKDYIIDYRMKRAKEFLLDESLPIGNVAYSVGYPDPLNFSKMFKLKTGFSPSEYRMRKTM